MSILIIILCNVCYYHYTQVDAQATELFSLLQYVASLQVLLGPRDSDTITETETTTEIGDSAKDVGMDEVQEDSLWHQVREFTCEEHLSLICSIDSRTFLRQVAGQSTSYCN